MQGADYPVKGVLPDIAGKAGGLIADSRRLLFQQMSGGFSSRFKVRSHIRMSRRSNGRGTCGSGNWNCPTCAVVAQFLYPLDKPDSFARDSVLGNVGRSDIKVSEAVAVGGDEILILERASHTTKIYRVRLDAGGARWRRSILRLQARPTLEELSASGPLPDDIPVVAKELVLSSDDAMELPPDMEGMVVLSPRELLLVNDNEFWRRGCRDEFLARAV